MKILAYIPNGLTCANLLCGCVGIVFAFNAHTLHLVPWIVGLACVFDFFDGFMARLLRVSSSIGKELDSLADVVSFGLLPACVVFQLMSLETNSLLPYFAFAITLFSALRLAIFNIDENQKDSFVGLPTPANALFITSLVYISFPKGAFVSAQYLLLGLTAVSSYLLVSPIRMFGLKFKNFSWKDNKWQVSFVIVSASLFILLKGRAWLLIIPLYVIVSFFKSNI